MYHKHCILSSLIIVGCSQYLTGALNVPAGPSTRNQKVRSRITNVKFSQNDEDASYPLKYCDENDVVGNIPLSSSSSNDNDNHMKNDIIEEQFNRRAFLTTTTAAIISTSTAVTLFQPEAAQAASTTSEPTTINEIFAKASKKALSGGKAGASASIVQVLSLMWLRTSMNYQYRYGGTLNSSLETLYKEGGLPRLYQGLPFALLQGPLTRFGDTAANVGILVLLDQLTWAEGMPLPLRTACGSVAAGLWRIFLMPVDTSKTVMQVEGREGLENLYTSVASEGVGPLYRGALASAAATTVGHFPWFLTFNYLNEVLPLIEGDAQKDSMVIFLKLARSAFLGLAASCVSDCCSNSLRVIKTTKQTAGLIKNDDEEDSGKTREMTYLEAVQLILEKDGWTGLLGRGLKTRLLTNAIQGAAFSVLWRYFQETGSS
mmetsp:Transcript_18764/g.23010  ORF Transcript_18764/g.23010 Transcript_18764/m.23010 type:complete len:431 (+) Transcript_18764:108-1400(+)